MKNSQNLLLKLFNDDVLSINELKKLETNLLFLKSSELSEDISQKINENLKVTFKHINIINEDNKNGMINKNKRSKSIILNKIVECIYLNLNVLSDNIYNDRNLDKENYKTSINKSYTDNYKKYIQWIFENLLSNDFHFKLKELNFDFKNIYSNLILSKLNYYRFEIKGEENPINEINHKILNKAKETAELIFNDNNIISEKDVLYLNHQKTSFINSIIKNVDDIFLSPSFIIKNFLTPNGRYYIKNFKNENYYINEVLKYFEIFKLSSDLFEKNIYDGLMPVFEKKYPYYDDVLDEIIEELDFTIKFLNKIKNEDNFLKIQNTFNELIESNINLLKRMEYSKYYDKSDTIKFSNNLNKTLSNNNVLNPIALINNAFNLNSKIGDDISYHYNSFNNEFVKNKSLNNDLLKYFNMFNDNSSDLRTIPLIMSNHFSNNFLNYKNKNHSEVTNCLFENEEISKENLLELNNMIDKMKNHESEQFDNVFYNMVRSNGTENFSFVFNKNISYMDNLFFIFLDSLNTYLEIELLNYDEIELLNDDKLQRKNNLNCLKRKDHNLNMLFIKEYLNVFYENILIMALFSNDELFENLKKDDFFNKYIKNYSDFVKLNKQDYIYELKYKNLYNNFLVYDNNGLDINYLDRIKYLDELTYPINKTKQRVGFKL